MTLPTPALHAFGAKILLVALASAALPTGHAAARNHDLQVIRIPSVAAAPHDRAPCPVLR